MPRHDPLDATADFLDTQGFAAARFGMILGTGFGSCVRAVEKKSVVPYGSIPHFPVSTVKGHEGNLVFGALGDASIILMQGRIHLYEGYDARQIAYPLEVMRRFGVEVL
ncbi:MAG: purine-nucleoside phosphorylase, partial [candidate division Zixibacteria bacterium]|nr:purine-nucleoside phosphorylase [candidate division Zixibacteria bacterium]